MQAVAVAKDVAFRRGHLPVRDDARQGRVALICVHCGARAGWESGQLRGLLLAEGGRCIGFEPVSARERELRGLDAEEGWAEVTAVGEANWAVRASRAMAAIDDSRPSAGRWRAGRRW